MLVDITAGLSALDDRLHENPALQAGLGKLLGRWPVDHGNRNIKTGQRVNTYGKSKFTRSRFVLVLTKGCTKKAGEDSPAVCHHLNDGDVSNWGCDVFTPGGKTKFVGATGEAIVGELWIVLGAIAVE